MPWGDPIERAGALRRRWRFGVPLLAVAASLALAGTASAAELSVTNTNDFGAGSLRAAITTANDEISSPGPDTITVRATGAIELLSPLPELASEITIAGPGAGRLAVTRAAGAPAFRIFSVGQLAQVRIDGLTVRRGALSESMTAQGGGIRNAGQLTLRRARVIANAATTTDIGGAGGGGGIFSTGSLTIDQSTIAGNSVSFGLFGSGILASGGLTVRNSTVSGNTGNAAVHIAGADPPPVATIENSTIAANQAIGVILGWGQLTLRSSTIAGNDGLPPTYRTNLAAVNSGSTVTMKNTLIADQPAGGVNCQTLASATITSNGFNLASDASCPLGALGDKPATNPRLGPLADNGGPTRTRAIPGRSPAVDAGKADALTSDQRGGVRPYNQPNANAAGGDGADIGAFELSPMCGGSLPTKLGTGKADKLAGTPARDVIVGLGGADRLNGRGGSDTLCGGAGRDRLRGGPGPDLLIGGPGRDVCIGGPGRDRFRGCEVRR